MEKKNKKEKLNFILWGRSRKKELKQMQEGYLEIQAMMQDTAKRVKEELNKKHQ